MKLFRLPAIAFAALLIGAAPPAVQPAASHAAERIRAHVEFLASDLLKGRDTGSTGHEIAAGYVASQFRQLGLTPAGTNGSWFVQVPFRRATLHGAPRISLTSGGRTTALVIAKDAAIRPSLADRQVSLAAPLVFVGYGISDRRLGIDDYAGLDVRGKIAVALGDPAPGVPSEIASHLSSIQSEVAAAKGAVGFISIDDPTTAARDLERFAKRSVVDWVGPQGQSGRAASARVAVSSQIADRLFRGAPMSLQQVRSAASSRKPIKGFELRSRLKITASSRWEDFTSPEVVAVLPGSDP
ncbi:MAG TPA: peptidase M28, partial [Sphingomicrobium sp.]|nr:peptidase M28 [Sphingomicrobium sp.]